MLNGPSQYAEQLDVVAETSWRRIVRTLKIMIKLTFYILEQKIKLFYIQITK